MIKRKQMEIPELTNRIFQRNMWHCPQISTLSCLLAHCSIDLRNLSFFSEEGTFHNRNSPETALNVNFLIFKKGTSCCLNKLTLKKLLFLFVLCSL